MICKPAQEFITFLLNQCQASWVHQRGNFFSTLENSTATSQNFCQNKPAGLVPDAHEQSLGLPLPSVKSRRGLTVSQPWMCHQPSHQLLSSACDICCLPTGNHKVTPQFGVRKPRATELLQLFGYVTSWSACSAWWLIMPRKHHTAFLMSQDTDSLPLQNEAFLRVFSPFHRSRWN